jgi:dihydropyrimidinase
MMKFDAIVTGGKVVTPGGVIETDIGVKGEKIAALGQDLIGEKNGATVVDATGHLVLPGVIDVHVHLELPFCGTVSSDDYRSGTRAGARGGVTTLMDFAIPYAEESLSEAVDNWHQRAEGKAMIDYAFHLCITRWHEHRHQIKDMFNSGVTSFKEFMIYESEGWQSDDRAVYCTLEELRDLGGMLMVHAETARVLDELIERHHKPEEMEKYGAELHAITRPQFTEYEAIQRAITWCEVTGGTLYVVHMSTGTGADMVRQAQERGVKVLSETCPQYLVLDDSVFARPEGPEGDVGGGLDQDSDGHARPRNPVADRLHPRSARRSDRPRAHGDLPGDKSRQDHGPVSEKGRHPGWQRRRSGHHSSRNEDRRQSRRDGDQYRLVAVRRLGAGRFCPHHDVSR